MKVVRAYAPGRTELAGNHTDHQGGRVIAAAVDCGIEITLEPNSSGRALLASDGFSPVDIDVADLAPKPEERGTTSALVRGVIARMRARGAEVTGFDARAASTVPPGSGLSSSAAFELALACAIEEGFEGPSLTPVERAKIGQAAERDYFGKPCGLMDQLAVALGGVNEIDFSEDEPVSSRIGFDFSASGYALCIIDTHCDHSLYTEEYAQVALDMFAVAELIGAPSLSRITQEAFLARLEDVREELGDLPALRALHYYNENRLVSARAAALGAGEFEGFLELTRRSAASSAAYLQNVSTAERSSQPAMVVLALADVLLAGRGASRIHGGGFGGTVQAFVPDGQLGEFTCGVDAHLGEGSCRTYRISEKGAYARCL